MRQRRVTKGIVAALVMLLGVSSAFSQTTGIIEGRVIDSSGALLPRVTVTATSPLARNRTAVTDSSGWYRMPGVPPGAYTLQTALAGFAKVERSGVRVSLDRAVNVEFSM